MQKLKKTKVLITGGAGFIGQAVARYFTAKGLQVKTLDILQPSRLIHKNLHEHYLGSIMYVDELYKAMQDCDYVVHLAAMLGVKRTEQDRIRCLDININGTRNVFEAAMMAGVKKVVFSSSSEVYGEPLKTPISEEDRVHPKSIYAVTKLAGEEYLRAFKKQYGKPDYSIVRFFNIYGPGQVAEFVAPKFIKLVMENKPPVVNGDGSQTRSFCYVDDAAKGVYLALFSKKANGETFNIGNDKAETSMLGLAQKIISLAGKENKIKPQFVKDKNSDRTEARDILKRMPDIRKAKTLLGYQPTVSLDKGLKLVMDSGNIPETWLE